MSSSRDFPSQILTVLGLVCTVGCFRLTWGEPIPWKQGRATYFDAPDYWKAEFEVGQFGDLHGNSCGYVDRRDGVEPSNEHLPFPIDGVAAITDVMEHYTGGCGRCYEVRCKSGPIMLDEDRIMPITEGLYLSRVAPDLVDTEGRSWPGVPDTINQTIYWTQCRNENETITVTTIDSCPCKYIGGREQSLCCGPIDHFDLSFWAFNKLAHPLYGLMMLEYRPVECASRKPLESTSPSISAKIYDDRPGRGWSWRTYYEKNSTLIDEGQGLNGSAATCVTLTPTGGLAFWCRQCQKPGYQPFDRKFIQFWIRSTSNHKFSFTPPGEVPNLQMFMSQSHELKYTATGTYKEPDKFCDRKPNLADYMPLRREGNWYKMMVPIKDFGCTGELSPALANRLVFTNPGGIKKRDAHFCLDEVEII